MSAKKKYNNYSKMSEEASNNEVTETAATEEIEVTPVAPVEEVPTVEAVKVVYGKVVDCPKLNVRWYPNTDSDVIGTIEKGTEVELHSTKTTNGFYEVQVKIAGLGKVKGHCMKKYIAIKR